MSLSFLGYIIFFYTVDPQLKIYCRVPTILSVCRNLQSVICAAKMQSANASLVELVFIFLSVSMDLRIMGIVILRLVESF